MKEEDDQKEEERISKMSGDEILIEKYKKLEKVKQVDNDKAKGTYFLEAEALLTGSELTEAQKRNLADYIKEYWRKIGALKKPGKRQKAKIDFINQFLE